MMLVGSPEWFYEKSLSTEKQNWQKRVEDMREQFLKQFSPTQLMKMDGSQLLRNVFSDAPYAMIRWLMFSSKGWGFGSAGKYKYLGILYYKEGEGWRYKEGAKAVSISLANAAEKATYLRDQLIRCINDIKHIGTFSTIHDYRNLQNRLERVFFSRYPWVMKYYQMVFPQFFPGMYADKTLERAIHILGLRDHGTSNRIMNAGEVSLFIRRCDINNIVFGTIYGDTWGWEMDFPPCEAASDNYANCSKPTSSVNLNYYSLISEI